MLVVRKRELVEAFRMQIVFARPDTEGVQRGAEIARGLVRGTTWASALAFGEGQPISTYLA